MKNHLRRSLPIIFIGLAALVSPAAAHASTYYVDNSCVNNGTGATTTCADAPGGEGAFNSLAAVQSKTGGYAGDDSLLLKRGTVFREMLVLPSSGTLGHPITISAYGTGNKPLVLGSDSITAWTLSSGSIYVAAIAWNPNMVFNDDVPLKKVSSKAAMKAGSFYVDTTAQKIYVWLPANVNPSLHVIEASHRPDMYYGLVMDGWTGNSNLVFDGLEIKNSNWMSMRIFGGQNITVRNVTISNGFHNGIIAMGIGQGAQTNPDNISITDNSIRNNGFARISGYDGAAGISVDGSNGFSLLRNVVDKSNAEGIETYNAAQNGEIAYNLVSNQQLSGAIYVNGSHGYTTQNISVHHNRILNATTTASVAAIVAIEGSATIQNISVYGNVITGYPGGGGLVVGSGSGVFQNNKFYNNTISGTLHGIELIGTPTLSLINNEFKNNIVSLNSKGYTLLVTANTSTNNIFDYNLAYNPGLASPIYWLGKLYTFAAFKTATGKEAHGLYAAPKFVVTPSTEYSLQSTSPAINSGAALPSVFGAALVPNSIWPGTVTTTAQSTQGTGWERGAYVYLVTPVPPPVVPIVTTSCTYSSNTGTTTPTTNAGSTQTSCQSSCVQTRNTLFGVSDGGVCSFKDTAGKTYPMTIAPVSCFYSSNSGTIKYASVDIATTQNSCVASCISLRDSAFSSGDHGACVFNGFSGEQVITPM